MGRSKEKSKLLLEQARKDCQVKSDDELAPIESCQQPLITNPQAEGQSGLDPGASDDTSIVDNGHQVARQDDELTLSDSCQ